MPLFILCIGGNLGSTLQALSVLSFPFPLWDSLFDAATESADI
jgi:hypothetical protein